MRNIISGYRGNLKQKLKKLPTSFNNKVEETTAIEQTLLSFYEEERKLIWYNEGEVSVTPSIDYLRSFQVSFRMSLITLFKDMMDRLKNNESPYVAPEEAAAYWDFGFRKEGGINH